MRRHWMNPDDEPDSNLDFVQFEEELETMLVLLEATHGRWVVDAFWGILEYYIVTRDAAGTEAKVMALAAELARVGGYLFSWN